MSARAWRYRERTSDLRRTMRVTGDPWGQPVSRCNDERLRRVQQAMRRVDRRASRQGRPTVPGRRSWRELGWTEIGYAPPYGPDASFSKGPYGDFRWLVGTAPVGVG